MSKVVVIKFGGTSVGSIDRIRRVSEIVAREVKAGFKPAVVVSAMSGVTNDLMAKCLEFSGINYDNLAEFDVALSSGEQASSALLALALRSLGLRARSLQGWQLPIQTDDSHFNAKVVDIEVEQLMQDDIVPVISGFQGISKQNRVTTLGKGGSDITACLLAAKLGAARCEIYTDVEGIYTADPRVVSDANKFEFIDRDMLYWLSASGAKVMHQRAVLCAVKYGLELVVRSSLEPDTFGTKVTSVESKMEQSKMVAVTSNRNIIKLLLELPKSELDEFLAEVSNQNIVYNNYRVIDSYKSITKIELILPLHFYDALLACLQDKWHYELAKHVATISLIGYHLKDDMALFTKIANMCKRQGAEIHMASREDMKIELMVDEQHSQPLVKLLHDNFIKNSD